MKNKTPKPVSLTRTSVQSQLPYVPVVTILPPITDPQSQLYSLVILNDGIDDGLYSFQGSSLPEWIKIADLAGSSTEPANFFFAGPVSGAAAIPTFRAIDGLDLPIVKAVNITPVSVNASTTADQDLMTISIPANALNAVGKLLEIICFGTFDEDSGPTITFKVHVINSTPIDLAVLTFVPNTPGSTKTNLPWRLYIWIATGTAGVSGLLEVHGEFSSDPTTLSGRISAPQLDLNTARTSTIDLTLTQTIKITIAFSASSTSNVGRQRMMTASILN